MNEFPLIELYRPKDFNEVIGVENLDRLVNMIEEPSEMPNLLFHGPQGTGKTSVAKIIIEKLNPIDYIKINGSDDTGIDNIRERVYNFMTAKSSIEGKPKIIWIEEFDYLTHNAFAALRAMIEQYIKNARLICTANYLAKIPEPIQSRFTLLEFKKPKDTAICVRLKNICDMEGIKAGDDILMEITNICNGDVRASINLLQQLSSNEIKTISSLDMVASGSVADEVYEMIESDSWDKIRREIPLKNPDYNSVLVSLEEKYNTPIITEIISDGLVDMATSFDKAICFSSICSRIIKVKNHINRC